MTLQGRGLLLALLGAAGLGAGVGAFAAGWAKARGVSVEATVDAGVRLAVDAGTSSHSDCGATVEHWTPVYVPGPVRYIPGPDGQQVQAPPETVAILVPELRLTGSGGSQAVVQASGEAEATAHVVVAPVAPEKHWELGPAVLYGFSTQQVLAGAEAGWSSGPFGVRVAVMKGPGDVYAGGALVWRW
jgi:hypothetical protein